MLHEEIGPKFPHSTMTEIIMHVDDRGLNGATAALHFSELGGWGPLRIQVRFLNGTSTEACISFCCEVVVTTESYIFDHMV